MEAGAARLMACRNGPIGSQTVELENQTALKVPRQIRPVLKRVVRTRDLP